MKILVVDDSKTMRHVLITQLKELGYSKFLEADCVAAAKQVCSAETPTLIISDWNMPGASGLDLLKAVRANTATKEMPFIMLTTETDRTKIVEATRAGLQSYLLKPIRKPVLSEKMRELAAAYGFPPPMDVTKKATSTAKPTADKGENSPHPLTGKFNKDRIADILQSCDLVWKGESSGKDFETFIAEEILIDSAEEGSSTVTLFMDMVRETVQGALDRKLNQLAG
jgi:two-component system chemotaxis response regulator CheY